MTAKSCRKIDTLLVSDQLLGTLQDAKAPLSVSELARLTGLTVDMVFRQLGTMEDLRWVERIGEGYVLGMWLAVLWARRKAWTETRIERGKEELAQLNNE